ncbi:hypothetical protein IMSHALPRED_006344 [Imshaugia aleurites]|uniref:Uncharacterized protein n=1 Tax=Imshaugia aleurites TaxID=172621 RepID=A0A8H3FFA1_9LECA|nr:hypothetical protein IMSHALPRED_006344 [Imshaugia aleurites]
MVKKPCKFFALGTCTRGQACTYSHEVASSGNFGSRAGPFVPPPHSATSPISFTETKGIPCRFHSLGRCNKGVDCTFEHLNEKVSTSNGERKTEPEIIHVQDTKVESDLLTASENSTRELEARDLRGASVMFGPGAQVYDLNFPSDYSAVQMTSLQLSWDAEAFQGFLATLGETVPLSSIRIKTVTRPHSIVATARIRDSGFAQRLKLKADTAVGGTHVPDIAVTILQVGSKSESSANRLQMSTVSCTWYKPSRVAWLHYNTTGKARAAERFIESRNFRIGGREIQATLQVPEHRFMHGKPTVTSVQLGNLDASTPQATIERHIPGHLKPVNVVMGKPSYSTPLHEAEDSVRALLSQVGPLDTWEPRSRTSATQVKAIARFQTGEDARKAVNQLSGQKMPELGNSKLFISPLISVKFNLPKAMYSAIRGDVDHLKSQIWDAGHVHIKAYSPVDPTQKNIAVRLYGEYANAVAKAKSSFEKILTGDVAMKGDIGIWDDFFTKPEGLAYLNELGHTHRGYVYRDLRKHRLSLYGSADSKERLRRALILKLGRLMEMTHRISLSAEDLRKALQGGFRRIVATLGKHKASLDIRQRPQFITIVGSARDLETARALLDQDVASDLATLSLDPGTDQPDCAVCWTEAEDAYRTPCNHLYCSSCFANQCSTAGDGDLPVRCLGASGTCLQVLGVQEIKHVLPSDAFEQLLEDSFTTYVRTNPKNFQYCPTPDCQQIYRVSADGNIFTCPACLTPICTTCQVTSHDGVSCEVYQRVRTEGDEEFRTWKRENHVKDCPVCKVPIEKSFGCNHMECGNCKAHICWVCLETFGEGRDCYGHMQEVHGSIYEEED